MSTTNSLDVVCAYAQSQAPLIFRFKIDSPMEMGADISWISLFPKENETCYPPLTYVKPMFKQRIKDDTGGGVVITLKPSFPS
jgi:hypothetical protein